MTLIIFYSVYYLLLVDSPTENHKSGTLHVYLLTYREFKVLTLKLKVNLVISENLWNALFVALNLKFTRSTTDLDKLESMYLWIFLIQWFTI